MPEKQARTAPNGLAEIGRGLFVTTVLSDAAFARLLWSRGRSILEDARTTSPLEALVGLVRKCLRLLRIIYMRKSAMRRGAGGEPGPTARHWGSPTHHEDRNAEVVMLSRDGTRRYFNLRDGRVTTHFPDGSDAEYVEAELTRRRAVPARLAPQVLSASVADASYVEQYINGPHARPFHSNTAERQHVLFPLLTELRTSAPQEVVDLHEYAAHLVSTVQVWHPAGAAPGHTTGDVPVHVWRAFASDVSRMLANEPPTAVALVLSHGDLTARNVLFGESGPTLIDWGTAGMRSQWHDLLSVHFIGAYVERYIRGTDRLAQLPDRIRDDCLAYVSHRSANRSPAIDVIAPGESEMRWIRLLHYLEVLALQVEGFGELRGPQRDGRRTSQIIGNWVMLFRDVEPHFATQAERLRVASRLDTAPHRRFGVTPNPADNDRQQ